MNHQEIPIASVTVPSAGLIPFLRKNYEMLSDDLLQEWFYELFLQHMIDPSYLFVSLKTQDALFRIMREEPYSTALRYLPFQEGPLSSRYLNRVTGRLLHVVVLPTLPDAAFFLGDLKIAE